MGIVPHLSVPLAHLPSLSERQYETWPGVAQEGLPRQLLRSYCLSEFEGVLDTHLAHVCRPICDELD
jgi:hypothetical protein